MFKAFYVIAIDAVVILFFRELLITAGLCPVVATYYAPVLAVVISVLGLFNLRVREFYISDNVKKPLVIDVDGAIIYQEIGVSVDVITCVAINVAGVVVPLAISAYLTTMLTIKGLLTMLATTLLLIIIYRRLSRFMAYRGVGVPLGYATLTTLVVLASALEGYTPTEAFAIAFTSTFIASLVGLDIVNIKNLLLYRPRAIYIGGLGVIDALFMMPSMTALTAKLLVASLAMLGGP